MSRYLRCTHCGKKCYHKKSPEIVFQDPIYDVVICENCSVDFKQDEAGNITPRFDYMVTNVRVKTDKKANARYWDNLDHMAEKFVKKIAKNSIVKTELEEDDIISIAKEVLTLVTNKITEQGKGDYPYLDESM